MVTASQARQRKEMGEDAWRAYKSAIARRHRSTDAGRAKARLHTNARNLALARLAEAHPVQYRALLDAARYELGLT
jgi:hypothetical protein